MTRKDFNKLAVSLASVRPGSMSTYDRFTDDRFTVWERSVEAVADACAGSNPRFDRERFISACHKPGTLEVTKP